jgi:aspartyl protease family protein
VRHEPILALGAVSLALAATPSPVRAQADEACVIGREIVDDRGGPGTIVGGRGAVCLVKYQDGRMQAWVPAAGLRDAPQPDTPAAPPAGNGQSEPGSGEAPGREGTIIIRPKIVNRLVYRADALGHVVLTAKANDAPVRFLVDTGATLVGLSPDDAKAAGIDQGSLTFNQSVHTANGTARAAWAELRQIRIDRLEIENVPVAVIENLKQSVLGMSFLKRLKGFDMRDGLLTMSW